MKKVYVVIGIIAVLVLGLSGTAAAAPKENIQDKLDAIITIITNIGSDVTAVQGEVSTIKRDVGYIINNVGELRTDVTAIKANMVMMELGGDVYHVTSYEGEVIKSPPARYAHVSLTVRTQGMISTPDNVWLSIWASELDSSYGESIMGWIGEDEMETVEFDAWKWELGGAGMHQFDVYYTYSMTYTE